MQLVSFTTVDDDVCWVNVDSILSIVPIHRHTRHAEEINEADGPYRLTVAKGVTLDHFQLTQKEASGLLSTLNGKRR